MKIKNASREYMVNLPDRDHPDLNPVKGGTVMNRALVYCLVAATLVFLPPLKAAAVGIGDKAPEFKAISDKGEVSLDSYRGQKYVILAFYFAINTPA